MNKSKIAIMQPYIFPYLGYMNLVSASDEFVFYDDVNFIKGGWINRNSIILMSKPYRFTIPLKHSSQNKLIKDIEIANLEIFSDKFLKQISISYKNSKYKNVVLDYVREVLFSRNISISELAIISIKLFFQYLGVKKSFLLSSKEFSFTKELKGAERLISITQMLGSKNYINSFGGMEIYDKENFIKKGINLQFVKPYLIPYAQCNGVKGNFYSNLSIIDIMMNLSQNEIKTYLENYDLV